MRSHSDDDEPVPLGMVSGQIRLEKARRGAVKQEATRAAPQRLDGDRLVAGSIDVRRRTVGATRRHSKPVSRQTRPRAWPAVPRAEAGTSEAGSQKMTSGGLTHRDPRRPASLWPPLSWKRGKDDEQQAFALGREDPFYPIRTMLAASSGAPIHSG